MFRSESDAASQIPHRSRRATGVLLGILAEAPVGALARSLAGPPADAPAGLLAGLLAAVAAPGAWRLVAVIAG